MVLEYLIWEKLQTNMLLNWLYIDLCTIVSERCVYKKNGKDSGFNTALYVVPLLFLHVCLHTMCFFGTKYFFKPREGHTNSLKKYLTNILLMRNSKNVMTSFPIYGEQRLMDYSKKGPYKMNLKIQI